MERIGERLAERGWILRSGGAPGADQAFYKGAQLYAEKAPVENYLPWDGFEVFWKHEPSHFVARAEPTKEAYVVAQAFHPNWFALKQGGRKLMARNSHQVMGYDLDEPADCIICWTKDGKLQG